jgi:hypothetical protein
LWRAFQFAWRWRPQSLPIRLTVKASEHSDGSVSFLFRPPSQICDGPTNSPDGEWLGAFWRIRPRLQFAETGCFWEVFREHFLESGVFWTYFTGVFWNHGLLGTISPMDFFQRFRERFLRESSQWISDFGGSSSNRGLMSYKHSKEPQTCWDFLE